MNSLSWDIFQLHPAVSGFFAAVLSADALAHAYLFRGPSGVGKRAFARSIAALLVCQSPSERTPCGHCLSCQSMRRGGHPDILFLRRGGEEGSISVEQARDFQTSLLFRPVVSKRRVAIIEDLDILSEGALQSLLKTLEEPPAHLVLLLIHDEGKTLLPTIVSRCQQIRFSLVPFHRFPFSVQKENELPSAVQAFVWQRPYHSAFSWERCQSLATRILGIFSQTSPAKKVFLIRPFIQEMEKKKEAAESLIDMWTFILHRKLLAVMGLQSDLFYSAPTPSRDVLVQKLSHLMNLRDMVRRKSGINIFLSLEHFLFE